MWFSISFRRSACALLLLMTAEVQAAPTQDAGSLQRNQHPTERSLPAPIATPAATDETKNTPVQTTITVSRFVIEGATVIPTATLEDQLKHLVGKSLSLAELESASLLIADYYRNRGWFVRVWLPQQEIRDGTVRIALLESKLSSLRLQGGKNKKDLATVGRVVAKRLQLGKLIMTRDLERNLLLANDMPGVSARIVLEPGENAGETILNVDVKPGRTFSGDVWYNTYGHRATAPPATTSSASAWRWHPARATCSTCVRRPARISTS